MQEQMPKRREVPRHCRVCRGGSHAGGADGERPVDGGAIAEGGQGVLLLGDVHGLDDEQVVVEGDDRVDQGYQYYEVGPEGCALVTADGCHEDEELREHASEGRC